MIDRNFILNICQKSNDINEYLMSLYNLPVQIHAQNIVEIGAGVSTFALVAAANKIGGKVTSIDVGGLESLKRLENGLDVIKDEHNLQMIEGNSLEVELPSQAIDFLFLDSEHTLDLTRSEIQRWFPLVRAGGLIAMHDTGHEDPQKQGARVALDEYLDKSGDNFAVIHLLDTKLIGLSILTKLRNFSV